MESKKSNHQANIVRISEVKKHGNADSLEIVTVGGYQAVSRIGTFKVGEFAVYIQPDSVVPQTEPFRFIWEQYMCEPATAMSPGEAADFVVPEKRRRITAKKLRGEWSEGLLMPLSDFKAELSSDKAPIDFVTGGDVSDLLGITHYDPDRGTENTAGDTSSAPRRRYPRSVKGWFFFLLHKLGFNTGRQVQEEVGFSLPVYDVDAFKNFRNVLKEGEPVVVTEKIHGSNARFVFFDGKMYAGSRTQWKSPKSNCVWRKALAQNPWIETWCRLHPEHALYGEVAPTQKGFNYGAKDGEVKFFVFDILLPNGSWMDWIASWPATYDMLDGLNLVPVLHTGPFREELKGMTDGKSLVPGASHIREGIVIKPQHGRSHPGLGRVILKLVSNVFLEKDSK